MPAQPLPSTSVPSPISPTPHRRTEDVGIPERSDVAYDDHDASIWPGNGYRDTASEVPSGSSLSTVVQHHTRRFTPNDPYSKLTLLQRDVLLCIKTAAAHNPTPSVYPTPSLDCSEHTSNPTWKGVHVSVIIQSVTNRHPELDLGLPEFMLVASSLHTTMKVLITIPGTALTDCRKEGISVILLTKNITAAPNLTLAC